MWVRAQGKGGLFYFFVGFFFILFSQSAFIGIRGR